MQFLTVGDSHTQYFGISNQMRGLNQKLRGIRVINKAVSASTVTGVGKLDSTLKLGTNIHQWIDKVKPNFLVLNLGQVDVELGIPFRQFVKQRNETEDYWLNHFVQTYDQFLQAVQLDNSQIIIKGINLPVLCYDHQKAIKYISRIVTERFTGEQNDLQRTREIEERLTQHYPSDIVRTDLARRFNTKLETLCSTHGYGYFDINSALENEPQGTISPRFMPSKFDHHIVDSLEVRLLHWDELLKVARRQYWNLPN